MQPRAHHIGLLYTCVQVMPLTQEEVCDGRHDEAADSGPTNGDPNEGHADMHCTHYSLVQHFHELGRVNLFNFFLEKRALLRTLWRERVSSRSSTRRRKPTAMREINAKKLSLKQALNKKRRWEDNNMLAVCI